MPRRWAHTQGVAAAAASFAPQLGCDAELLVDAAILHDIGYAPRLVVTGFHPLDGARFLRDTHVDDERLLRLIANHTFALLEAQERGLGAELEAEFPVLNDPLLVDILTYCDVTTSPDGTPTTAPARVAEILARYGPDTVVGRFIQRCTPQIFATVERVEHILATHPR
jgi:putative nucleotidyltransferase with HDIG domain